MLSKLFSNVLIVNIIIGTPVFAKDIYGDAYFLRLCRLKTVETDCICLLNEMRDEYDVRDTFNDFMLRWERNELLLLEEHQVELKISNCEKKI